MSSLLRKVLGTAPALEDDTEDYVPEATPEEVMAGVAEVQAIMTQEADEATAVELLEEQLEAIDTAKRTGDFPPALEAFSNMTLRQTLSLFPESNTVAMEALSVAHEDSGVLRRAGKRIVQSEVVGFKQFVDSITQTLRSTENRRDEYERRLEKTENELHQKRDDWEHSTHDGNLAGIALFFLQRHRASGESKWIRVREKDPIQALHRDTGYSKYLLQEWPKKPLEALKRLTSIVGSARVKDDKDMIALAKKVEGLGYVLDQFRKDLLEKGQLLDYGALELSKSRGRSPASLGDVTFDRLAEQSNYRHVQFTGRAAVKVGKALMAGTAVGSYVRLGDSAGAASFKYTDDDITTVIKQGRLYLDGLGVYQKLTADFTNAYRSFSEAMGKFYSNNELSSAQNRVARQFAAVGATLRENFVHPSMAEVNRALIGARMCNYLALRMIASAS